MIYAVSLSPAQQRVVKVLRGDADADETITIRRNTLRSLLDMKVVELDENKKPVLTDFGKLMNEFGWCDPIPAHQKFGHQQNVAKEKIRDKLLAGGHPDDAMLHFKIDKEWVKQQQGKPSYSERQKAWHAEQSAKHGPTRIKIGLTDEEIEHLRFLLQGTNSPIGQDILQKIS